MQLYYAGFNTSSLFLNSEGPINIIEKFTKIPCLDVTDMDIGWNYFLLWKKGDLYISLNINDQPCVQSEKLQLIQIPESSSGRCKSAMTGKDNIIILSENNDIWQYKLYENIWKKVSMFMDDSESLKSEHVAKIVQAGGTFVLTTLGRIFNIPMLIEMPKRTRLIDVATGFDHCIFLAENGDVYSMGIGTRGQLGHDDLQDYDEPKVIEALAGLKVIQISAGGWHNAVVTEQGDLYTWGWNTDGELGIGEETTKVFATPKIIEFRDENGDNIEANVKKVQCGNVFTLCMLDNLTLWGCGSNKYGQLGQPREHLTNSQSFIKLNMDLDCKTITHFKCREWGTVLFTD